MELPSYLGGTVPSTWGEMWLWFLRNEHLAVRGRMEGQWTCGAEEGCCVSWRRCWAEQGEASRGSVKEVTSSSLPVSVSTSKRHHTVQTNKGRLDIFLLKTETSTSFLAVRHGGSLPSPLVHQDMTCGSGKVLIPGEIILALGLESNPKRDLEKGMRGLLLVPAMKDAAGE